MPVPRLTYEFLCGLYGEAVVRRFWVPVGFVLW